MEIISNGDINSNYKQASSQPTSPSGSSVVAAKRHVNSSDPASLFMVDDAALATSAALEEDCARLRLAAKAVSLF